MKFVGKRVSYKGNTYFVEAAVESRHTETGAWYDAYLYKSEAHGRRYVREMKDFEAEFEEVPT